MKHPLFAIFLLLFSSLGWSIAPALRFSQIDLKDGLSQATVLDIIQDKQGFMWFATQDGLNRYDGYDFVVYRQKQDDANSLSENYVNNVFEDSNGFLWLTTRNGLNRFDPKTNNFERFSYDLHDPYSLSSNWTFAINEDHLGHIWVGSKEHGLNVYDPNTKRFNHYRFDENDKTSLGDDGIYDIFVDRTGVIWVATRYGGVSRFNSQRNDFTRFQHDPNDPDSLSHNKVYKIFQHSDGTLWFATRGGGLNRFDPQTQKFIRYQHDPSDPGSISSDQIWSIVEDHNGDLLVGTFSHGLNRLEVDGNKFTQIQYDPTSKYSISGDSVMSSFVDDTGILWFGIRDVGLNQLNQETAVFNHYRHITSDSHSLSDNSVQSFLQVSEDEILIGTREGGVNRFNRKTGLFSPLHDVNNKNHLLLTRPINQLIGDDKGNLWLGLKEDGLVKYSMKSGKIVNYRHSEDDPTSISSNEVVIMVPDKLGKLWLGTHDGLNLLDPKTGKAQRFYHDDDLNSSLGSNYLTYLLVDSHGDLWVGNQNGLDLYEPASQTFKHFANDSSDPTSISSNSILSMFEDSNSNLWVATTSGLNKFNREKQNFDRIRQQQGLSNDQVYGVMEDDQGLLWIATNVGVNRYDPETGLIKLFTQYDGLQNNEFNAGAFYKLSDGQLLFGGLNGFNMVDPKEIADNPFPPKMMITNFRIFNESVPVGSFKYQQKEQIFLHQSISHTKKLTLSHHESVFSLEFSALHYAAPALNKYAYRLKGFTQQWTTTDFKNRRATYTNLEAGNYTFEVKASNKDDVWSSEPAILEIIIDPPWWLTKVAKFAWLAMFFISVNVLYRWKTNQIRKQKSELQLQVTRQVAQVVAQKRALETSYNDIRIISGIGQKINASLDLERVLWSVYEDINKLMDGTVFGIGLYQPQKKRIKLKLALENGNRYKPYYRSMENKNQFPVWCIDHDEVVFVNDLELDGCKYLQTHEYNDPDQSQIPREDGVYSGVPQSFIYVPIRSSDKILGYISVQSFNRHAYQEVHVDILKTLAAYTGTAIINAKEHQQLVDSRKELIESQKMASLGALSAGVAHEINNPTNFIHVSAENLEVDLEKFQQFVFSLAGDDADEEILETFREQFRPLDEHINTIKDGTIRIKTIVKDLRAFTHLEADDKMRVNIANALKSTINLVKTQFFEYTEFVTEFVDTPSLLCYPAQLNQVFMNLIVNACDAIRHRQLYSELKERGEIVLTCHLIDDYVKITVSDDGCGMDAETKKRLFEAFYTTKEVGKGTGLGLSISLGIVKKHEGELTVESAPEKGSIFYLDLPMLDK
jgi:signal transduction histidine kinase/ligand-binding sensor domain-containing protein